MSQASKKVPQLMRTIDIKMSKTLPTTVVIQMDIGICAAMTGGKKVRGSSWNGACVMYRGT